MTVSNFRNCTAIAQLAIAIANSCLIQKESEIFVSIMRMPRVVLLGCVALLILSVASAKVLTDSDLPTVLIQSRLQISFSYLPLVVDASECDWVPCALKC